MANHKSAEKRNRQRIKRRARNLTHLSSMRTFMKRVRKALDGDLKGGSYVVTRSPQLALERWILDACAVLPDAAAR